MEKIEKLMGYAFAAFMFMFFAFEIVNVFLKDSPGKVGFVVIFAVGLLVSGAFIYELITTKDND